MNKERLLKLVEHLEQGKLGHDKFDFTHIHSENRHKCGTSGCALGELPFVFPEQFRLDRECCGVTYLYSKEMYSEFTLAAKWFDISYNESSFLFSPNDDNDTDINLLKSSATKEQVAQHIREFVKAEGVYKIPKELRCDNPEDTL